MHASDDIAGILGRVRGFAREHRLFDSVRRLFAGFSGGPDSTALLLILREIVPDLPLIAVHFHHGLRESADADAAWCRGFCEERGIPFRFIRLDLPKDATGGVDHPEQTARAARLAAWKALISATGDAVALGHNRDDAVETFILRAVRGANAGGLYALRPRRTLDGVLVLRPLLCLGRDDILRLLEAAGVTDWRTDETNLDAGYTLRNRVRHVWIPEIARAAGGTTGLLRTLEALAEDALYLEQAAAECAAGVRTPADLAEVPPALLPRVLRLWIRERTGRDVIPGRAAVRRVREALRRPIREPRRVPLGHGLSLVLAPDGLRLEVEEETAETGIESPREPVSWEWRTHRRIGFGSGFVLQADTLPGCAEESIPTGDPAAEVFREDALPARLTLRTRLPGDRIVPFGARHAKKVKEVFIDRKVPRDLRARWPLVLAGDRIIWIPGVLRAEFGRIDPRESGQRCVLLRLFQGPQGFGVRRAGGSAPIGRGGGGGRKSPGGGNC